MALLNWNIGRGRAGDVRRQALDLRIKAHAGQASPSRPTPRAGVPRTRSCDAAAAGETVLLQIHEQDGDGGGCDARNARGLAEGRRPHLVKRWRTSWDSPVRVRSPDPRAVRVSSLRALPLDLLFLALDVACVLDPRLQFGASCAGSRSSIAGVAAGARLHQAALLLEEPPALLVDEPSSRPMGVRRRSALSSRSSSRCSARLVNMR